jgi:hypothetical protein
MEDTPQSEGWSIQFANCSPIGLEEAKYCLFSQKIGKKWLHSA